MLVYTSFRFLSGAHHHRASLSHTNPMRKNFARIFLFLETAGLLDSRALYAIEYSIVEYNTAEHNAIHYIICFLGDLSSPGVKTVLKILNDTCKG